MSEGKSEARIERTHYPNGQVQTEVTYVGDNICGVTKYWHENGVLKKEVPMKNSRVDGTIRQWDSKGNLLGECELRNGTGTHRTWHENGHLRSELSMIAGVPYGQQRCWDEDGKFIVEAFYISGRRVSKKKYQEACAKDPSLPRYDVDDGQIPLSGRYADIPVKAGDISLDDYQDARDAFEWLQESSDQSIRTFGELASAEHSIALVREFLESGATKVLAIHIQTEDLGETTSELLVELPTEPTARQKALGFCNEQNRFVGYSPIKDSGQRYVHVILD